MRLNKVVKNVARQPTCRELGGTSPGKWVSGLRSDSSTEPFQQAAKLGRRDLLKVLAASGACASLPGLGWAKPEKKPNIVFILIDDMGAHQLSSYGNWFYESPNIDRLAKEGMRFTNAYAAAPICSPTRASLMTGKYPARLHLTSHLPGNPYPYNKLKTPEIASMLPMEEKTIAEVLKEAGYATGHFGKWHLNVDKEYRLGRPGDPDTQGFDEVLTRDKPEVEETAAAGADPNYDAHHVNEITDRSIEFIEKHKSAPFFCYISHSSIHRPVVEYAPRIVKYADKPEAGNLMGNNPVHGAMVESLDAGIGRVLDKLDELGLTEDTLVIAFSDNGAIFGREGLKPLYGAKADLYEGGVRVPLLVRWPGVVAPGGVCKDLAISNDFFPTLAEIAGQEVSDPEVDGISLLPALKEEGGLQRDTLFWHYPHYHHQGVAPSGSIREGRYKLIEWFEPSVLQGPETPGALELFDLETDPGERRNLVAKEPELAKRLHRKLLDWRKSVGAQEMVRNKDHDPERENWKQADRAD
jgi:arylsulfatase A-like enzyme